METLALRRTRTNRILAGVCGGLGNYFGIDPVIFRILFVLLALPGGVPSVLIYLILWLVMPEQ